MVTIQKNKKRNKRVKNKKATGVVSLVNLTKERIGFFPSQTKKESIVYEPSQTPIAVEVVRVLSNFNCGKPQYKTFYLNPKNVPIVVENTVYLVSEEAKKALPHRKDFLVIPPYEYVRFEPKNGYLKIME
jgi:hypothetical protein